MKLPIPFGNPKTYTGHSGVDFGQPRGTPIPASGPGTVSHRGTSTRGGCYIWVRYDNGPLVGYHHMDNHGGCPPDGTRVREGTRLGYVGSLGKYSTGPHLHSEISGQATTAGYWRYFDPNRVVGSKPAGDNTTPLTPNDEKEQEDDDMKPDIIGHKNEEVAVLAPWLPNGYLTAKVGTEVAIGWARRFSPTKDSLVPMFDRATYLGMIAGAKALADGYQAALPKQGTVTNTNIIEGASKADVDAAAARVIEQIPTVFRGGRA